MNGVLEMEGFQETFRALYKGGNLTSFPNETSLIDDTSITDDCISMTDEHVCSSGNGASSDVFIVSLSITLIALKCLVSRVLL